MKKATVQYIKCPRCELNYILKKDKFCDVCKSEMKAGILKENDMEELEYLEEGMELCPICKVNYVNPGERMCTTCQEEQVGDVKDDEPDWRGFVDKADDTDDEELDLLPVEEDSEIDEELEGAFAEDLDDSDFDDGDLDNDDDIDEDDDDDFDSADDGDFDDDDDEDEDDYDEDDDDDYDEDMPKRKR